jgi:hypothetical protein
MGHLFPVVLLSHYRTLSAVGLLLPYCALSALGAPVHFLHCLLKVYCHLIGHGLF